MILHIDLDCFFVAAARIKDSSLIGKKVVVVGGNSGTIFGEKDRLGTVILSASYEARKFGVKSAMSLNRAKALCQDLTIAKSDMAFYKELSSRLFKFLYTFTPDIEKFSIDEFFVDLSGIEAKNDPLKFAKELQEQILKNLKLPCSIGISEAKFIAKLTTDLVKPFGVGMIKVDEIPQKLKDVDISKFPGVGASALKFLNKYGIYTITDAKNAKFVFEKLGKSGIKLYENLTGTGENSLDLASKRKSFSHARTFDLITDRDELERRVLVLCRYLSFDIYKFGQNPTKFDLKVRYEDRYTVSHSVTVKEIFTQSLLQKIALELFKKCDVRISSPVMYISIGAAGFVDESCIEKTLFSQIGESKNKKANLAIQQIREKYGINSLMFAKEIKN
ncbi:DNA polymerase Y family protein [Campylobacter geochelonis]|uniref:DNA-directed DNA polymerase n=1 Tax=Campylobacter geochelonis TaxID=1780362 RepID=A0A128EHB3_9BACT|nr:DNA polymerase IV [Campylobacter geochelonis]QKF71430.1 DNA polymerase IV [Campylobacter geochelonis]CZE48359.1 DNA-directed DNA polymerase [Campylobacter geochelonis]CZE50862.1 DNA-directed DNA polymerase [Campylobacter geochelonis]